MTGKRKTHFGVFATLFVAFWAMLPGFWAMAEGDVLADAAFEEPGILHAADLLPDYLLAGDLFTVESEVRNDGETNHYTLQSPLGYREAAGRDELRQAIQEIRALDLLNGTRKRTGAAVGFNQGMKNLATAPYRKVKRVAFNPLYAVQAVPSEIADYAGKLATVNDLFRYGPFVFVRRSLGIDGARNYLAKRLQVDSDTDNEALQAEIRRVGWGVWAGGFGPKVGDAYVDLGYDLSFEVGNAGDGNLGRAVDAIRREVFPRSARRLLKKLHVPKDLSKAFRDNDHYSGRMRENMAIALLTMEETEGRTDYVAWANTVKNESEARDAVQLAQVMAVCHALEEPITHIQFRGSVLVFEMADGEVVAPLLYDYLIWTEAASDRIVAAAAMKEALAPGSAMEVWSAGEVSPRVREELLARGYAVRTNVDEDFPKFERPRKGLERLEQRYEQRVEDPLKDDIKDRLPEGRDQRLVLAPLGPETGRR